MALADAVTAAAVVVVAAAAGVVAVVLPVVRLTEVVVVAAHVSHLSCFYDCEHSSIATSLPSLSLFPCGCSRQYCHRLHPRIESEANSQPPPP